MSVKKDIIPMISVVMSVYNEEQHVSQAMESILNQTFNDFEFIIVNDGSVDKTYEIIKRYAEKDKRIRIINHAKREGLANSLNDGIKIAQGKYIARMDADDISLPERFQRQVEFMERNPQTGAIGSCYQEVDESGNILPRKQNPRSWKDIKKALFFYNPISHPTVMIRKEVLKKAGTYDETFPTSQDYELFSRIAQFSELRNHDEVLLIRRFPKKVSGGKMQRQTIDSLIIQIRMLKRGSYPLHYVVFMLKNLIALVIPVSFREKIRRWRHRYYS